MRHPTEISFALAFVLLASLPFWLSETHDHDQALLMRPGGIKADTVEICGDSAFVRSDKHIELTDWRREWIKHEPIVDKPF